MWFKIFGILLITAIISSESSKILFINPTISQSHLIPLQELAKVLATRGHKVTFVSVFPLNKDIPNFEDIGIKLDKKDTEALENVLKQISTGQPPLSVITTMTKFLSKIGNDTIQSKEIKTLMDKRKFDLLVMGYFMNEFLLGLADHFKCPSIIFFSGNHMSPLSKVVGNPISLDGAPLAMLNSKEMKFVDRVKNILFYGIETVLFGIYYQYYSKAVYK